MEALGEGDFSVRLLQEVRNIGKEEGMTIDESYLPVKLFFVGPAEAGKTTLLNTLFHQGFSFKSLFGLSKKPIYVMKNMLPKKACIDEKFAERTIGVEVHSKVLENIQLLIFDLGGQQSYYSMQSIFLDLENSFFLLVVDLSKPKEVIEDDIKSQLSIIASKLPKHGKAEAILVGTHKDLLSDGERGEIISACKSALHMNCYPNLTAEKTVFMNAKEQKTDDIRMLERYCIGLAKQVKSAMSKDMKTLPNFIVQVLKALQEASEKLWHKILDWETVLSVTRKAVLNYGIQELAGIQVFIVASFLGYLGMVLVASPIDSGHDLELFESNLCKGSLITDISWFLRDFLGTIYSPECFLSDPSICHDGYISQKYIDKACREYNIEKDVLISVLDYFHIILEHGVDEVGEKRFLIPSLLKRKQEDNMWTSFNEENCPFYYIIGRTCLSSITLNPSTVAVIQHVLGNRGKDLHATIDFFQDGLIMAHEELIIIMNAILLHSGVCIKIGVRKDDCKPNRSELKSLIVKSKKLMDEFFTRMCCGIVSEKNPSSSQERHVISLVGMMKGSDKISYPLSEVQNKFQDKVRLLHFCPAKDVKGDRTTLLLTQLETASKDNELAESQLNDYLKEILPDSSHEGTTGTNNWTNLDLRGATIQTLNTGQMTVTNVSGSRNVAIGNDTKFNVNES